MHGAVKNRVHPHPESLQRFLLGRATAAEKRAIVLHLLQGCRECLKVTRPVWGMAGSLEEEVEVLEAQAVRPRPNHEICCISRAWRDES